MEKTNLDGFSKICSNAEKIYGNLHHKRVQVNIFAHMFGVNMYHAI